MISSNLSNLHLKINSLTVFYTLKSDSVISALTDYLSALESECEVTCVSAYSKFICELYDSGFFSIAA